VYESESVIVYICTRVIASVHFALSVQAALRSLMWNHTEVYEYVV
jgi:uncharacterized MAPEG superfamily protein